MNTRVTNWYGYSRSVLLAAAVLPWIAGCGGEQATAVFDAAALLERIEQDRRRHDPHAYSEVELGEFTITWRSETSQGQGSQEVPAASTSTSAEPAHGNEHEATGEPTTNHTPPATNHEPPTTNHQPPTTNQQPATSNQQPATNHEPPATNNQQPATSNQPPPTTNQQPATNNQPPPITLIIRFHLYAVVSDNQLEECRTLLETHGERVRSQVRETVQGTRVAQLEDPGLGWLKSDLIQSINQSLQAPILRDVAFAEFALDRG